jgi:uncharacterized membrane protein
MSVFLPLVIVVVLILAGVYVVYLRRAAREGAGWKAVALTGLVAGIVAAVLTALIAVLSLTPLLDSLPFREPLAMIAFLGIPAALVGVGCGILGLKSKARSAAVIGLALSALSIITFTAMEVSLGG